MLLTPILGIGVVAFLHNRETILRVVLGFTVIDFGLAIILWSRRSEEHTSELQSH